MNIIINAHANIDYYPELDKSHPADSKNQLTIGDLHGNALKLIYFLIRQNVIVLDPNAYSELVRIYKTPVYSLTKEDIDAFHNIIGSISALPVGTVRLIGDELSDRGSNDYFTLKILERLGELKVPVEVLISNHSTDFMDQYETQDDFIPARLTPDHSRSMLNLQSLITKGLIQRSTIDNMVANTIKPILKALSYTLDKENNKITIYSHAGIDLSVIESLSKKLGVEYCHDTIEHLAQSIDLINAKIALHLHNNTLHTLYHHEYVMSGYMTHGLDKDKSPLEFIMWNRYYSDLARPTKHANGYGLDFIHGHDPNERSADNIFNLDNVLGKDIFYHQGDYSILYSQELPSYQCDLLTKKLTKLEAKEEKPAEKPIAKREIEITEDKQTAKREISLEEKSAFDKKAIHLFAELKKAGLLSKENRELVYEKIGDYSIDTYASAIPILKKANILTQESFEKLLDHFCLPELFATLLELNSLTQETFNKIITWEYTALYQLKYAFAALKLDKNLYTKENALLLISSGKNANEIMQLITMSQQSDTQSIFNLLVRNAKYTDNMVSFLHKFPAEERAKYFKMALELDDKYFSISWSTDELIKHKLASQENLEIVFKFKQQYGIGNFLILLNDAKLLTTENREALLKLPQLTDKLMRCVKDLIEKNGATQDNFACLLQAGNHYEEVTNALINLEKIQQCTPLVRNLIIKYPKYANDIYKALQVLKEKNLLATDSLEMIERSLQLSTERPQAHQFAQLLYTLNSLAMLTPQTRELACKNAAYQEYICEALHLLANKKQLTHDLCLSLLECGNFANSFASLYIRLIEANLLTPEMQNTLLAKLPHAHELSSALWKLQDEKTLSKETWNIMLENSEHASNFALAYNNLAEAKLLEHFPTLIKHAEHVWSLAYAITNLQKAGLFNKDNYAIILAHPESASSLADSFVRLSRDEIYTDELRDLLVYYASQSDAKNSYVYSTLPHILSQLNEVKLLNKSCLTHLQRLNAEAVHQLFSFTCQLKKYRLLTEKSFITVTTAFNQKSADADAFFKLLERLDKAGLISPAKLKRSQATFDKLIEHKQHASELVREFKDVVPLTMEIFDKTLKQKRELAIARAALTGPKVRFFSAKDSSVREVVAVRPVLFHKAFKH